METLAIQGGEPVRKEKLPSKKPFFDEQELEAVQQCLQQNDIGGDGPFTRRLEEALCEYLGIQHAFFTNSCTTAIHMALLSLDITKKEIMVPDYAFASIANVGFLNNNIPRLVDVEEKTANMGPEVVEKNITKETKVIIPVHYAGHPCDMDKINECAKSKRLFVVEDAAQALGSEYKGRKAGTLSDVGCFSFHETKNITCGEGGLFVTNDDKIAERASIVRDKGTNKYQFLRGKLPKYETVSVGNSYLQSDILAAILLEQLKKIDKINALRTQHAAFLNRQLQSCSRISLPSVEPYAKTNWHLYTIRVPAKDKEFFIKALNAEGVSASFHFIPLHQQPLFKKQHTGEGPFTNSKRVFDTLIKLPLYPSLDQQDLQDIVAAVEKIYAHLYGEK